MRRNRRISRAAEKVCRRLNAEVERLESRTLLAGTGSISGVVFNDLNASYIREAGESGVGGAIVYLDVNHDGRLDDGDISTQTDAMGAYSFGGLDSGSYSVAVVPPAGWANLFFNAAVAELGDGGTVEFDPPLTQNSITGGQVYVDANGDGRYEAGEQVLGGFTVYVDTNGNGQLDPGEPQTVTDAGQYGYRVQVQPGGTYEVHIAPRPGFRVVGPGYYHFWAYVPGVVGWGDFAVVPDPTPTAVIGGPYTVNEGSTITLDCSGSYAPAGTITQYQWDLDYDGTAFSPTDYGVNPTFAAWSIDGPSQRTIALRVVDDQGTYSPIVTTTVNILNVAPTATFRSWGNVVQGESGGVWFDNLQDYWVDAWIVGEKYSYDFNNDGIYEVRDSSSMGIKVPAEYLTTTGPHIIRGKVEDKDGASNTYTTTIDVERGVGSIQSLGVAGGNVWDVAISGNFTYALVGGRLEVLDVSNPSAPVMVSRTTLDQMGYDIDVKGSYAYVVSGLEVQVLDISDPTHPAKVSICGLPISGSGQRFAIDGSLMYVADGAAGLQIVDISDPLNPTIVGTWNDGNGYAKGIRVSGTTVYLDCNSQLVTLDVSDVKSPQKLSSLSFDCISGIGLSGSLVLVTGVTGLQTIDVSDPTSPRLRSSFSMVNLSGEITMKGNLAYVASGSLGVWVFDISDPDHPAVNDHYETDGYAWRTTSSGSTLYVADGPAGLKILSESPGLQYLSSYGLRVSPSNVVTVGPYVYTACENGLNVLDVQDPSHPTVLSSLNLPLSLQSIRVIGTYAYLGAQLGLYIVDISNPAAPVLSSFCSIPNGYVMDVDVQGHYAYAAANDGGLEIVDVADPAYPVVVGSVATASAFKVRTSGSYAYVADAQGGLKIIDVSDPAAPRAVGSWAGTDAVYDVTLVGHYALLAAHRDGLVVLDVTNPLSPAEVTSYNLGLTRSLYYLDGRVYAVTEGGGVYVLSLPDPGSPLTFGGGAFAGADPSSYQVFNVYCAGDRIYASAGADGLHLMSFSLPGTIDGDAPVGTIAGVFMSGQAPTTSSNSSLVAKAAGPTADALTASPDETFTYTLVDGVGSDDNGLFTLDGDALVLASSLNGMRTTYSVRVRATGDQGHVYENTFQINAKPADSAPTDITLSSTSIAEHQVAGTAVGSFTTIDPDKGDTHTYSLVAGAGSADNGYFTIDGDTLKTTAPFDYLTKSTYKIRVRSTDAGGLFVEKTFKITVQDVAPQVLSVQVNDGSAQRSIVNKLVVTFSEPVALNGSSFQLQNRAGSAIAGVSLNASNPKDDKTTWELTFSGIALQYGSLRDGTYKLLVSAANVTDLTGHHLTADYRQRFFRAFGDMNGDHMVDRTDLVAFRQALNSGTYIGCFDFDNSGTLTLADYRQLRKRLQGHLL